MGKNGTILAPPASGGERAKRDERASALFARHLGGDARSQRGSPQDDPVRPDSLARERVERGFRIAIEPGFGRRPSGGQALAAILDQSDAESAGGESRRELDVVANRLAVAMKVDDGPAPARRRKLERSHGDAVRRGQQADFFRVGKPGPAWWNGIEKRAKDRDARNTTTA
jgi:hypothetical protein